MELNGTGIMPEKAAGKVYFYEEKELEVSEDSERTVKEEKERLNSALEDAEKQLEEQAENAEKQTTGDEADIFRAQIQFLNDPQIKSNVIENIKDGLNAEKAVEEGFEQPIEQLESQEGRMKERADDLRDIRNRLIRTLSGKEKQGLSNIPENSIVVAENLKPSDTADMDNSQVKGIVTAKGSKTSHVAILSKSMGIPAVVGTGSVEELKNVDQVLVNGIDGKVIADPTDEQLEEIEEHQNVEIIDRNVETSDGKQIEVAANVANPEEVSKAVENGADGIGLYRTEFMFLEREDPPTEEEHLENYVNALNSFPEEIIVVRTIDIGGDKPVPYLDLKESDNPFLGLRGIRLAFDTGEEVFNIQMRALLRAAATGNGDNLAVMFPMISSVEEFESVLDRIEQLKEELNDEGKDFEEPEIGLMVETPSAVQMAHELAGKADFLSIGTNDLTQYTMAASRTDSQVADLQNPLYPAVIRSIHQTVKAAHEEDAWVGMCGEMAGNPELTELLVGLGLDELSMSSRMVPRVKNKVEGIQTEEAKETAENAVNSSTKEELEKTL